MKNIQWRNALLHCKWRKPYTTEAMGLLTMSTKYTRGITNYSSLKTHAKLYTLTVHIHANTAPLLFLKSTKQLFILIQCDFNL